ncbi:TetR/AcrR family transcriptional regulator [Sinimarinibacterium sp. NLF-5-8]|uniref:TetR/AcrR family transcriptional regulator n=1 Tax=Sinimarinibacterium sp. NLF-5-8 TaxID=2698684 RepID=UPI00137C0BE2|nr:TetR/AcrR family transcriptional regulator [Sinimarinibacterium sp. NLF-5-8]QHS10793.1 TetR/AcrR family transcriptional regulator [Sinimarinibacterium sp. NLF-5-8]
MNHSSAPPSRRRQAERSEQTRARILDATLDCLAQYGYAGTGVAQVIAQAGVSRGAWSHHFASMNALIVAAAEHLMQRVYAQLGQVMRAVAQPQPTADTLLRSVWRDFFVSEVNEIYLQLLIAARHAPELANTLRALSDRLAGHLDQLAATQVAATSAAVLQPLETLALSRWVLRGLALDAPLMPQAHIEQALDAWIRLLSSQIERRSPSATRATPRR